MPIHDPELSIALTDYHIYIMEILNQIKDFDVWYEQVQKKEFNKEWYKMIKKQPVL